MAAVEQQPRSTRSSPHTAPTDLGTTEPQTWHEYLAELNERLDLAMDALRDDTDFNPALLETWKRPQALGPIPLALAPQARHTLDRYEKIEPLLAERANQLRHNLQLANAANAKTRSVFHYGDESPPQFHDSAV